MTGESPTGATEAFDLGEFRVEPQRHVITGPSGETIVEPKIMAVLLLLAQKQGQVVTRSEFLDTVWSREYSGDESLTRSISQLRKILCGPGTDSVRIETVTKTGYRLLADPAPRSPQAGAPARGRNRWVVPAILVLLVVGLALYFTGFAGRAPEPASSPANTETGKPVVAVLPFENQSAAGGDRFLSDGLADEVLSALARSPAIAVIAGTTSFQFQGDRKRDLDELMRQLRITHLVDGSVRRSEEGLRVAVHLVDARSGLVLRSEVITRPESEAYAIPEIAAAAMLEALGSGPLSPSPRTAPPDRQAYEAYLQARALLRETSATNLMRATTYLEDAVERDPALAEAWALLASARLLYALVVPGREHSGFGNRDPDGRMQAARREAGIALTLDPNSVDAALALAVIDYRERILDPAGLEQRLAGILQRAPRHPDVNKRMGMTLNEVGRDRDALVYLEKAFELDPWTIQTGGLYLQRLAGAGRLADAEAIIERGQYDWIEGSFIRLEWLLVDRDFEKARDWLRQAAAAESFQSHGVGTLAPVAVRDDAVRLHGLLSRLVAVTETGRQDDDPDLPADLVKAADEGLILHYYAALFLSLSGYREPAFELARERIALDDLYIRQALFRPSMRELRRTPSIFELFAMTPQLDYWRQTGKWPDFCDEPGFPYDCREVSQ